MPTAHVNGVNINYELEGDGERVVVLVNGLADDRTTWLFQTPALVEAGYRVLTYDNRGIGSSDAPPGPYTTRLMAEDGIALVRELGIEKHHLLGVSMGGMIAQEWVLTDPSRVRSATFACTYAAPGPFCSRMYAMWADLAPELGVPFVMRDVTLWAFTQPFFEEREDELREFEGEMAQLDMAVETYLAQLSSIRTHDTTDRIGGVSLPALVLAGEEDILIPVHLSRRLHEAIPGSSWETVPGGHACMWEHPDAFNAAVTRFLSDVDNPKETR